jgi:hypothetical protein
MFGARRLLEICKLKNLPFDEKFAELAVKDLLTPSDFATFPVELPDDALPALQYIRDCNRRSMLLHDNFQASRAVALADIWLSGGQTYLLTSPDRLGAWVSDLKKIWPNAVISIFGHNRFRNEVSRKCPTLQVASSPDFSADFLISGFSGFVRNNVIRDGSGVQSIVDEQGTSFGTYEWIGALGTLLLELPKPVFLRDYGPGSGHLQHTTDPLFALNCVENSGLVLNSAHMFGLSETRSLAPNMITYLRDRGYKGNLLDLYSTMGISSHLLSKGGIRYIFPKSLTPLLRSRDPYDKARRQVSHEQVTSQDAGLFIKAVLAGTVTPEKVSERIYDRNSIVLKSTNIEALLHKTFVGNRRVLIISGNQRVQTALALKLNANDAFSGQSDFLSRSNSIGFITPDNLMANPHIADKADMIVLATVPTSASVLDGLNMLSLEKNKPFFCTVGTQGYEYYLYQELVHSS